MKKMYFFVAVKSNINAYAEMGILRVSASRHDNHLDLNKATKKCAHNQFARQKIATVS
jgi:hypothetical protein